MSIYSATVTQPIARRFGEGDFLKFKPTFRLWGERDSSDFGHGEHGCWSQTRQLNSQFSEGPGLTVDLFLSSPAFNEGAVKWFNIMLITPCKASDPLQGTNIPLTLSCCH